MRKHEASRGRCPMTGKAQFDKPRAEELARQNRRRDGEPWTAFKCHGGCPWWHLAHQPPKGMRRSPRTGKRVPRR